MGFFSGEKFPVLPVFPAKFYPAGIIRVNPCDPWPAFLYLYFSCTFVPIRGLIKLYGERGAATTGGAGIGIFEGEAPVIEAILPVYQHAMQIEFM